jgi:hypothetical protein
MGAFKTYFHQANPRVEGGFVYMRVWLGHAKAPETLKEDLNWWLQDHQYGLYPRSIQAERISVVGWLLYSTREVSCSSLQAALEKRFDNKFEVGCRYRMISLGRRGAVPKSLRCEPYISNATVRFSSTSRPNFRRSTLPRRTPTTPTAFACDSSLK